MTTLYSLFINVAPIIDYHYRYTQSYVLIVRQSYRGYLTK